MGCDVYLAGFSQGAMMSLDMAMAYPQDIKGAAILSGILLNEDLVEDSDAKPQLFVSHGKKDPVLTYSMAEKMITLLKKKKLNLEVHIYPEMQHSVGRDTRADLVTWFNNMSMM